MKFDIVLVYAKHLLKKTNIAALLKFGMKPGLLCGQSVHMSRTSISLGLTYGQGFHEV